MFTTHAFRGLVLATGLQLITIHCGLCQDP